MQPKESKNTRRSLSADQQNRSSNTDNQRAKKSTETRASAQRLKREVQPKARPQGLANVTKLKSPKGSNHRQQRLAHRQGSLTLIQAIEDYLLDHEGGNHSPKTVEWHRTALGLL